MIPRSATAWARKRPGNESHRAVTRFPCTLRFGGLRRLYIAIDDARLIHVMVSRSEEDRSSSRETQLTSFGGKRAVHDQQFEFMPLENALGPQSTTLIASIVANVPIAAEPRRCPGTRDVSDQCRRTGSCTFARTCSNPPKTSR